MADLEGACVLLEQYARKHYHNIQDDRGLHGDDEGQDLRATFCDLIGLSELEHTTKKYRSLISFTTYIQTIEIDFNHRIPGIKVPKFDDLTYG